MLGGFFTGERDPATGLTAFQRFGRALDPLILPEMRMGEQITQRGKDYLAGENRNNTIEALTSEANKGDVSAQRHLMMAQNGVPLDQVLSSYVNEKAAFERDALNRQAMTSKQKSFTMMTGKQINEIRGTNFPPDSVFNVSSDGKVTPVDTTDKFQIGSGEKEYDKQVGKIFAEQYGEIQEKANSSQTELDQIGILRSILDSGLQTGAFTEQKAQFERIVASLGGDPAEVDSVEAFEAISNSLILAKMGGSLGAGFSEGDRKFVVGMGVSLGNSTRGNQLILTLLERIAERNIMVAQIANEYVTQNGRLDAGFQKVLRDWAEQNPITADLQ